MSPTIPSRLAVRWLRLCSYHREERVLGRLATLARTSLLFPRHRKWMKDNILGMLAPPLFTRERQAGAAPSRIYHSNREKSVSSLSHILSSTGKLVAMYSHQRKSIRDPKKSQEPHSERERERERIFAEHGEVRDLHEVRADYAISEKVETFRGTSAVGLRTFEK